MSTKKITLHLENQDLITILDLLENAFYKEIQLSAETREIPQTSKVHVIIAKNLKRIQNAIADQYEEE